jgi:predicted PolB exonuclease-like 3'-5' exonuclease
MTIFLDIETVPAGDKPTIDQLKVPGTMSKPETIQKWKDDIEARKEDLDDMYRKRALNYFEGRVLCIAFAIGDAPVEGLVNDNEEELFKEFEATLGKHDGVYRSAPTLVAHNGRLFDYPYMFLRACKYNCHELIAVFSPPNFDFFKDTMKMSCLTDFKGMVSLKNACAFFGIEAKTGMEGSEVYDEYLNGNSQGILDYCKEDVENVRKLFKKLTGEDKA